MPMVTSQEKYDPGAQMPQQEDPLKVITELLKQKGISRFAAITRDWEGDTLPGGTPNESGMVFTDDGRVFSYWLDWDPEKIAPDGGKGWYTLGEGDGFFHEVTPEAFENKWGHSLEEDERVQRAKRQLGLV